MLFVDNFLVGQSATISTLGSSHSLLEAHQKRLLSSCEQRLCFHTYLCFQIITVGIVVYWKSLDPVTNPTSPLNTMVSAPHNRPISSHIQPHQQQIVTFCLSFPSSHWHVCKQNGAPSRDCQTPSGFTSPLVVHQIWANKACLSERQMVSAMKLCHLLARHDEKVTLTWMNGGHEWKSRPQNVRRTWSQPIRSEQQRNQEVDNSWWVITHSSSSSCSFDIAHAVYEQTNLWTWEHLVYSAAAVPIIYKPPPRCVVPTPNVQHESTTQSIRRTWRLRW